MNFVASAKKVVLHDHLDGGLRPTTIIELAKEIGYSHLPSNDPDALATWFFDAANSGSLERYLETFTHTLAVMQNPEHIARVASECVQDLAADNVVWAEIRMAPELATAGGLSLDQAIEAMLEGIRDGQEKATNEIHAGLLLCAMRHRDRHLEVAQAVVRFRDQGVVGFDIAGPERGFPASRLVAAFDYLRRNNARITVHAGEDGGLESIQDALLVGAERLGHGVEIINDISFDADGNATLGRLATYVRDRGVLLELCPSSNLQTGVAAQLQDHPFNVLRKLGFAVSLNCDNRLMSNTTPTQETQKVVDAFGLTEDDLRAWTHTALSSSFAPYELKTSLLQ